MNNGKEYYNKNKMMYSYMGCYNKIIHNTRSYNVIEDEGPNPFVTNIEEATKENKNFRTTTWTGDYLQITLMSIDVNDSIGLEVHNNVDQFIRIEQGVGIAQMGDSKDNLDFQKKVSDGFAFVIPSGKWHNLINIGKEPIKLYSIYAPPQHNKGTVHINKSDEEH